MQCGNSFSTSPPLISLLLINDVPTLLSGKCPISLDYLFEMSLQVASIHVLHQKFKDSLCVAQKLHQTLPKGYHSNTLASYRWRDWTESIHSGI